MCRRRLQALSRDHPLLIRLILLTRREVRRALCIAAAMSLGLWVAAYTGCVMHALFGG